MNLPITQKLENLIILARTEPLAAAKELRVVAAKLINAAEALERRASERICSVGGSCDRVQMQVVGPDNKVSKTVDTGEVQ